MRTNEEPNPKPYFIALVVMMILLTVGALMFTLMPETVESILYGNKSGSEGMSIKELRENGGFERQPKAVSDSINRGIR